MLGCQTRPRECIAHQVNRFVALLWLDAVDGDDDAPVLLHLCEPLLVLFDLTAGSQERTVRLEQVQDFAPRDRHSQGSQPILYLLMHLIDGLVLPQVQTPHQQHDVHTKGEAGQGQRIGSCTAVRPPTPPTLRVWTAIARMIQLDYPCSVITVRLDSAMASRRVR